MHPLPIGIFSAALAVVLGAFGAHAIRDWATPEHLHTWHTAVEYQLWHALALILLGLWQQIVHRPATWIMRGFAAGIVLFSGSLYLLVLTDARWFGAITPLGGLCFITSWLGWGWMVIREKYCAD